ncbi:hypothetical protein JOC34_000283 [Virgibacillus halotolerans]|uniref:hypothetical protein n=1 Tax=Virgibacillus halotolerans TaxID=1071053 RepID=UPI00195F39B5|nr:hypothetical protein [Virgibacillus halotolerans]MBM7597926.1 hypothetical protein [Virgibacillus halotolerans]
MDWIFDNFFIVIVIIAGIYGFLKDKTEKQKQQQRKSQNNQRPTATPSGTPRPKQHHQQEHKQRQQPQENVRTTRSEQQQTVAMKTIEEQQKEQMKQFANKYKINAKQAGQEKASHKAFIGGRARDPKQDQSHTAVRFKKQMKNNLGRKGLINSIVMAEVMGPPRAKKPYKSIIHERNK